MPHSTTRFDLNHWQKVEDLTLIDRERERSHFLNNSLPKTAKRCHLEGHFVAAIRVTSDHQLKELKLDHNGSITSLEGYGFERVAIIECRSLNSLSSLEGLGFGRNRKVTISYCHALTDFSLLNNLPIVVIKCCKGFSDPLQLRSVRDLTIVPYLGQIKLMSFTSAQLPHNNPFEAVHSLTLTDIEYRYDMQNVLVTFDGLEKIPYLIMDLSSYPLFVKFVKDNKTPLQSQRIEILNNPNLPYDPKVTIQFHQQYMHPLHYKYRDQMPHRLVWFRK